MGIRAKECTIKANGVCAFEDCRPAEHDMLFQIEPDDGLIIMKHTEDDRGKVAYVLRMHHNMTFRTSRQESNTTNYDKFLLAKLER